jgi:replicative DNA helicase
VDLGGDGRLTRLTGGIAPGNLWYIAARLGVGKSWKLLTIAVAAAEAGWNVKFYSLEMSTREVVDRLHMIALRDAYHGVWEDLGKSERAELMDEWAGRCGRVDIADPTGGPVDASVIAANHEDGSIAIVDYIGLMRSATGQRAVEDWRAAAMISNQLKEVALEHSIPIVSAAQVNREGARSRDASPEHLAQSDALGQDADVLVTIQRDKNVSRVHEYSLVKNRHGTSGARWYARFEPGLRRFEDIGADTALSLMEADREIAEAH